MSLKNSALILIGYQNDYFSPDGILHGVIEESARVSGVLANTLTLLREVGPQFGKVISTPIIFSPDYRELSKPFGILKTIQDVGAFQAGQPGSQTIQELTPFQDLILEIPGKRGLNAFSNTDLSRTLEKHAIHHIVLAGAVTSICIDSTGRHAADMGMEVSVLSDCTTGRTPAEQDFYCENVFPLYAQVLTHRELVAQGQPTATAA